MKDFTLKFKSLILLSCFIVNNSIAQTPTTEIQSYPSSLTTAEEAIGRVASDSNHLITYYADNAGPYKKRFVWTDPTIISGSFFDMDDLITVKDFERISDTIFFCGSDDFYGVVGYFTESLFTTGAGAVNYTVIKEVTELEKMEVYSDPNSHSHIVAAVGCNQNNSVLFLVDFSGVNIQYNYFYVPVAIPSLFQDIAVTDNYIVSIGIHNSSFNEMFLTVIDKNTLAANGYAYVESAGEMNSLHYSITHLEKEYVAISTLVADTSSPTLLSVPIHVFDASMQSFSNSQIFTVLQKDPQYNEMQYFEEYGTLLLLQNNYYPNLNNINAVIYYLKPFKTTSYTASTIYDVNSYYYSLDRFPNSHFLATGKTKTDNHSFMIHDSQATPKFDCILSEHEKVNAIPVPNNTWSFSPTPQTNSYPLSSFFPPIQGIDHTVECTQQ